MYVVMGDLLTLLQNRSRPSQCHYLCIQCSTLVNNGGHLGHVTWIIYVHIGSPFQ